MPVSNADMQSTHSSRIGLLADLHIEPDNTDEVEQSVKNALEQFTASNVDSVIILGDLIMEGDTTAESLERLNTVRELYNLIDVPVYDIPGNHDVINTSTEQFYTSSPHHVSSPVQTFSITDRITGIMLDTSASEYPDARGKLGEQTITKLETELSNTEYAVLFSHHPLYYYELDETNYFSEHPECAFASDKYQLTPLLDEYQNVIAACNGHTHQENHSMYHDTPFFTVNAMTNETIDNTGVNGSYAVLEVSPTQTKMISYTHGEFTNTISIDHPTGNKQVAFGGTFDPIHDGHRQIFHQSFEIGDVTVGLTSNEMASKKRSSNDDVTPFIQRKKALYNELERISSIYDREYTIEKLHSPTGIVTDESNITHLVVSPETFTRGEKINQERLENGMQPLQLTVIDPVLADDGKRISSTRIRNNEIDEHGNVLTD